MITKNRMLKMLVVSLILGLGCAPGAAATEFVEQLTEQTTFKARMWQSAFRRLDARNKITIVVAEGMTSRELDHVIGLESQDLCFVVKLEPARGVFCYALIDPRSILLIKETPRGFEEAKAKETPAPKAVAEPKVVSEAKPAEPAKKGTGITVNK